jgi:outer membrane lipoprotein SlyB
MESNARSALHPVLTVAAIAVTVFSAVGVATLTGMIPQSRGDTREPAQLQQAAPRVAAPAPVAAKPKPVVKKKPAVRTSTPATEEPIHREYAGVPGTVESVREVKAPGEAKGVGVVAGGVAGAVLGHQVGSGRGNKLATILGAVGGAVAGNHLEKQARAEKRWEVTVRLDDGTTQTFPMANEPAWRAGDRVRLHEGQLLQS